MSGTVVNEPDAIPDRRIAWLAFSSTCLILFTAVSLGVAAPALIAGNVSARISAVLVGTSLAAAATILLARARYPEGPQQRIRRSLVIGGVGAASSVGVITAANMVLVDGGPTVGRSEVLAIVSSLAVLVAIPPIATFMSRDGRLARATGWLVDRSAGLVPWADDVRWVRELAMVGVVIGVVALGLFIVRPEGPLGHDESIYALKARSWISHSPDTGWASFRPLGMSIIGWIVLQISSTEAAFRTAAIVLSSTVAATMLVTGRAMFDRVSAILGTFVFVGTISFLRRATEFLNDLSAAGLLLAVMAVVWFHFERRPGGWWLLASAPLAAGAYMMRYGSVLGLASIALVAIVVWHRSLVDSWRQILATCLVTGALLVPHVIFSVSETGSVLGILREASTSVGGGGGGLADYLGWLPSELAGPLGSVLLTFALLYTVATWLIASKGMASYCSEARTATFLTATAVVSIVAVGAFTHGEPRFVFLALMALLLTGARGLTSVWRVLAPLPRNVVAATVATAVVAAFFVTAGHMANSLSSITERRIVLTDVASAIRSDTGQGDCEVRTSYVPELTWYTSCSSFLISDPSPIVQPAYLVLFENGTRQPVGTELASVLARTEAPPVTVVVDRFGGVGDGTIYRFR